MLDLVVLLAGFAVGTLAVVGINGARRGSRPRPVVADRGARRAPTPPARPYQAPPQQPGAQPDHGIRVNRPASASPPPAPPRPAPPAEATAVATGPRLAKTGGGAGGGAHLQVEGSTDGVDLGEGVVTLGRGTDQSLRIKDSRASRAHAVVRRRSKGRPGWELEDQGSANGTELNGHRIPDGRVAPLQDGDRIGIGDTVVVYREGGGAPPPPSRGTPDPEATRVQDR